MSAHTSRDTTLQISDADAVLLSDAPAPLVILVPGIEIEEDAASVRTPPSRVGRQGLEP